MIVYTVKKGDTLWKIAHQYRIELDTLISANPDINDPNYIVVGQQINIPEQWDCPIDPDYSSNDAEDGDYVPPLADCADDPWLRPCIYTAQDGETLEEVSREFMVPLSRLLYHNMRYGKREALPAGARIIIPDMGIAPVHPHRPPSPPPGPDMTPQPRGNATIGRPTRKNNVKKGGRSR